jgi:hypothetical protein
MATTTNYGWDTPDDTDLVKDGASAIRTLGSSVDTTVKNLNPETTLGDISYRSSTANTNTRLGIGTTGQVLTVSGGVPAWSTPVAGGMTLIASSNMAGLSSVTISSIPNTYKHLLFVVRDCYSTGSAGSDLLVRFNSDSGSNYTSWGTLLNGGSSSIAFNGNFSGTSLKLSQLANGSTTMNKTAGFLWIYDYTSTVKKPGESMFSQSGASTFGYVFQQGYAGTSAISSAEFFNGTFTTGTILTYGVN